MIFINFILTIGLFNMLEAFLLIYGTHIFDKDNDKKFNIILNLKHFWILGIINYIVQCIPYLLTNDIFIMLFSMIITFVIEPFILYFYVNKFMIKKSIYICYKSLIIYVFTLFTSIFILNITVLTERNIYDDIVNNFSVKILQIIIIIGVDLIVKKIFNKYCKKF